MRGESTSCWPTVASPMRRVARPLGTSPNFFAVLSKMAWVARAVRGVFSEGFQTTALPQTRARAAFQLQTATGKLKAEMMPTTPERVPGLHHAMAGALGRNGEAGELAGEAGGEGADVDHLLDFAVAFGEDFAGFDGDEAAESGEFDAELFAEEADELAAPGGGDGAPLEEGGVGLGDGFRWLRMR